MTTAPNLTPTSASTAPIRGTQSLVGVMTFVFKHPSLTALEILWRWLAGIPLAILAWFSLKPAFTAIPLNTTALESMTFLEPVRSVGVLVRQLGPFFKPLEQTGKWWIPLAVLTWTGAATLGRTVILRRANRLGTNPQSASQALPQTALYTFLRAFSFAILMALWLYGLFAAVQATVINPTASNAEPNLVLLTAEAVAVTLAAFLLWSTTVWLLDLRTVAAISGAPQRTLPHLRPKLIETNLVMGIVRVILFVLAMTFSASPLPFQSRETQAFINVWWVGVGLFYILSSDFFHVVRRVTYLRLLQSSLEQTNGPAPRAS